jgi:hypothetical protein
MSSLPSDFRIINVKRAHAAAIKSGIDVDRIDINPRTGVISIVPRRPDAEISKPGIPTPGKKLREWNE